MPGKKGSPDSQFSSPEWEWDDGDVDCKRLSYINEGDNQQVDEDSSDKFEEDKALGDDDDSLFYSSDEEYNEEFKHELDKVVRVIEY